MTFIFLSKVEQYFPSTYNSFRLRLPEARLALFDFSFLLQGVESIDVGFNKASFIAFLPNNTDMRILKKHTEKTLNKILLTGLFHIS
jgi:hypothetical protein